MKISIIGLGIVGNAIYQNLKDKSQFKKNIKIIGYDKYKNNINIESIFDSNIIFLALPTQYDILTKSYEYSSFFEVCDILEKNKYDGTILIKSTVEPGFTNSLAEKYKLDFIHNPEFLKALSAYDDFNNQTHIVLGKGNTCSEKKLDKVHKFYKYFFPYSEISICTATESESVKLFCNNFYAIKIQYFNEIYALCDKINIDYDKIVNMMVKNGNILESNTRVPGPDGLHSYGGFCFPKDTNALLEFMRKNETPHLVLEATIEERNKMRSDDENIINK